MGRLCQRVHESGEFGGPRHSSLLFVLSRSLLEKFIISFHWVTLSESLLWITWFVGGAANVVFFYFIFCGLESISFVLPHFFSLFLIPPYRFIFMVE